jgi:NAD-dependent deacetylase
MDDEKLIQKIANMLNKSKNTVVVTGAGISTEAGIPDFRGDKGIYRVLGEDNVLNLLNIDTFRTNPRGFYDFYRNYFMMPKVEPSRAHLLLAEMELKGYVKAVVTQNIDNLHQAAGSKRVIAVHGNAEQFSCTKIGCYTKVDAEYVRNYTEIVPRCPNCNSILKPDVVLFGEAIQNYRQATDTILNSQLLIVIGSSLTVYPLAGFVSEYCVSRKDFVIINKGHTALDHAATIKLDINHTGDALEKIFNYLYN